MKSIRLHLLLTCSAIALLAGLLVQRKEWRSNIDQIATTHSLSVHEMGAVYLVLDFGDIKGVQLDRTLRCSLNGLAKKGLVSITPSNSFVVSQEQLEKMRKKIRHKPRRIC